MHAGVRTVTEDALLLDAARLMHDLGVSSLVVEQESASGALGILTRKDIVEALCSEMPGMAPLRVRDVMTKPAIYVTPELAIRHCMRLMRMAGIRRAPVVKNGRLVGVLSNTDVFRWLVANDIPTGDAPIVTGEPEAP